MENTNATWNDFSTGLIQRDVSFQVSSKFLPNEQQTKAQMATLGQEMENLRLELQEHRVIAVELNPRTVDPNRKRKTECNTIMKLLPHKRTYPRVGAARIYGTKNWNTLKTKELLRKKSNLLKTTTKNEEQIMDQNNGLGANISKEGTRITIMIDLQEIFPTSYQNFSPRPNFAYGNNHPNNGRSNDQRQNHSFSRSDGNWSRNGSLNT